MKHPFLGGLLLFGLLACGILTYCKKDNVTLPADPIADETRQGLLDYFDQLPLADPIVAEDLVLPNRWNLRDFMQENDSAFYQAWSRGGDYDGLTPTQAFDRMIGKMGAVALKLTDRSKYQYPDNVPALNGLAYSWGSKDHTKRQVPPAQDAVCTDTIYGLDCSGFIYQLFKNAGVAFPAGNANQQRQKQTLETKISASIPALKNIQWEDLGPLPQAQLKVGDIIYWKDSMDVVFHIGMVFKTSTSTIIFHSIGRNSSAAGQCAKNLGIRRGPVRHFIKADQPLPLQKYAYAVMRASVSSDCTGCANNFCDQIPNETLIKQGLANFSFSPGKATKAESKKMLQHLCADIVHEYTFTDGTSYVCGKFPSGYEVTLWQPTYGQNDRYGVRFGLLTANHGYFGSQDTYFEIVK